MRTILQHFSPLWILVIGLGLLGCAKSAQDLYKDGLMEMERGNLETAMQRFEAAIEKDPTQVAAYKHLVRIYEHRQETNKLIDVLQKWIEQQPFNTEAQIKLASIYLQNNNFDQCYRIYQDLAASAVNPQEKQKFEQTLARLKQGQQLHQQIQQLKTELGADPNNASISLELGSVYFNVGKDLTLAGQTDNGKNYLNQSKVLLEQARDALLKQVKETPEAAEANIELASAYFELSQHFLFARDAVNAVANLEKAIEAQPEQSKYYFVLSQLQHNQKDNKAAVKNIRKAIQLEPDVPQYYESLSRYYLAEDDFEKCIAALKEADKIVPEKGEYLFKMAILYEKREGQREKVIDLLEQAIERNPKSLQYRFSLAGFLGQEKRYTESLDQLKQVILDGKGTTWEGLAQKMIEQTEKEMAQGASKE